MRKEVGGERGIRTLEGLLTLTPLAGVRLRPLGHLSAAEQSYARGSGGAKAPGRASAAAAAPRCDACAPSAGLRLGALALDAVEDLLALHRDALGCIDAEANLIALDAQDRHGDFFTDHHGFTHSSRQDKHWSVLR
jgi:hypothetical protein